MKLLEIIQTQISPLRLSRLNNKITNKLNIRYYFSSKILNNIKESNKTKKFNKYKSLYFKYNLFTLEEFISSLMKNLLINQTYTMLVKLNFASSRLYLNIGRQIGLQISKSHDIHRYKILFDIMEMRISELLDEYGFEEEPDFILIEFKQLKIESSLKNSISIFNKKDFNNKIISKNKIKSIISSNYLPLSKDSSNFGFLFEEDLKNFLLNQLIYNIENSLFKEGYSLLNNKEYLSISKVFYRKISNKNLEYVILETSFKDINNILISEVDLDFLQLKNRQIEFKEGRVILIFELHSGNLIKKIIDLYHDNNLWTREKDNVFITLENDNIKNISRKIKLDFIKNPSNYYPYKEQANPNFGVLDLESFEDEDGLGKVYNIGYVSNLNKKNINTYYLSDITNYNSNLLIILCIDSLLVPEYHKFIWYIHNMGNFDIIYIYKVLTEFNLNKKEEYYKLETLYKNNRMLRLTIRIKYKYNKYLKITFVDSYNILNSSLLNLSKEFNTVTLKSNFPYKFVTKETLNYTGNTPDFKFYDNLTKKEYLEKYNVVNGNWSLKNESTKYLKNDLICLLDILNKFNQSLYLEHNLQMTESLTISRLALNKFLFYYMKDFKLPLITKSYIFNFIYFGYYGGQTEVYIPYGENLFYYDVNSLYPFVSLQAMPGNDCCYIENIDDKGLKLENLFGFFYAKVKTNNQYLGLLPIKYQGLKFPNGEFEGVWSSEELKFAKENGYQIKVIKGYNFNKLENVFTDYVTDLYKKKASSTGFLKSINKSLLNNLLGRFGLNITKPITKTLNLNKLDYITSTREIFSYQPITDDNFLVTYNPIISEEICNEHGVNYIKVLEKEHIFDLDNKLNQFTDVSVAISAMVTSYARIYMNKLKLDILKHGGKIYYSDTDSLVLDFPLENLDTELVGKNIGKFKLEYVIKEGYFISNKTYCLKLEDGSIIIKAKGIKNESLNLEDFKSMYFNENNVYAIKNETIKNLSKGSVLIKDKEIVLQHDAFSKRDKIYSKEGIWIDTKPIIFNNTQKSIIPYI